ncbi:MAG: PQQ-like domain [Polyangiaceae bacterium]|nr:PQQ-like domain [Polyangiaceae bacterium]
MHPMAFGRRQILLLACFGSITACGSSSRDNGASDDERTRYLNETSTNWAMTRGYPRGTSYNPFEQELNPESVSDLEIAWQVDGEAYDLQSGDLLWRAEQPLPNAAVCKGAVFAVGPSIDKRSVSTGELSYQIQVGSADALFSLPAAKDSKVFFATAAANAGDASAGGGGQYIAYDVVERTALPLELPGGDLRTLAPAALTSGMLYSVALEPADEAFRYVAFATAFNADAAMTRKPWVSVLEEGLSSPRELPRQGAMVIGARVFVPTADGRAVVALDQRTGEQLWRAEASSAVASLAVNFDVVYAAGTNDAGELVIDAFEFDSGRSLFHEGLGEGTVSSQLAIGGDVLYLGTSEGALLAIDGASGAALKRVELGGTVGDPIVTRGRVFVGNGEQIFSLGVPAKSP